MLRSETTPRTTRLYEGVLRDGEPFVQVNGEPLDPKPSRKLRNHSPDGFHWGYHGSGPAQLALAILLDYYGNRDKALGLHQRFKAKVVAAWPHDGTWSITGGEIEQIVNKLEVEALGVKR